MISCTSSTMWLDFHWAVAALTTNVAITMSRWGLESRAIFSGLEKCKDHHHESWALLRCERKHSSHEASLLQGQLQKWVCIDQGLQVVGSSPKSPIVFVESQLVFPPSLWQFDAWVYYVCRKPRATSPTHRLPDFDVLLHLTSLRCSSLLCPLWCCLARKEGDIHLPSEIK